MTRNILSTSLDAPESDAPLRYYAAHGELGRGYCEALQPMEASTKFILARYPIDEILVLGEEGASGSAGAMEPIRLRDAGDLYDAAPGSLSAFDLYRSRIAQYIDEISLEQRAYDALLPEEERAKLIAFIQDFQQQFSERETKRLDRFFDELSCSRPLYEKFRDALFAAFPEARKDSRRVMKWAENYLYTQLKPTARLELLPLNENICARYVPAAMLDKREYWLNNVLNIDQAVRDGREEIDLYVSLDGNAVVDDHLVLNILDILISTPGSSVRLKKLYRVFEPGGGLAGSIEDSTVVSRSTDLVAAAHAFLNYSKDNMALCFFGGRAPCS